MSTKRRVLIVTTEVLPGWGVPSAGGGIRAHSLGEGLKAAGHEVVYSLPEPVLEQVKAPEEFREFAHVPEKVSGAVHRAGPDVVVFEQWQPLTFLEEADCAVVVDLPGPLLLEYAFRGGRAVQTEAGAKIRALAKADLFLYSNPNQKAYWLAWTALAGVAADGTRLAHVPICRSPELPEPPDGLNGMRFIYGGVFWPWQDPTLPLNTLIRVMEEHGEGHLDIFGGSHPHHAVKGEVYYSPAQRIRKSDRVRFRDMMPLEDLEKEYQRGGIALALMARNAEREVASTIRTIGYLWCGLPTVVNNYSYLAPLVGEYDAGWVADPDDAEALKTTFERVRAERDDWAAKSKGAQRLVRERFTWETAVRPLVEFVENPERRPKNPAFMEHASAYIKELENEVGRLEEVEKFLRKQSEEQMDKMRERYDRVAGQLHEREFELYQIRSKFLFRMFKKVQGIFAPRR